MGRLRLALRSVPAGLPEGPRCSGGSALSSWNPDASSLIAAHFIRGWLHHTSIQPKPRGTPVQIWGFSCNRTSFGASQLPPAPHPAPMLLVHRTATPCLPPGSLQEVPGPCRRRLLPAHSSVFSYMTLFGVQLLQGEDKADPRSSHVHPLCDPSVYFPFCEQVRASAFTTKQEDWAPPQHALLHHLGLL